jgi:hypothetical protein
MSQLLPGVPGKHALFLPATLVEKLQGDPTQPQLESERSLAKQLNLSPEEMREQKEAMTEAERKATEDVLLAAKESLDITKQQEALKQYNEAKRRGSNHIYDVIPAGGQSPDRHRHILQETPVGRNQGYGSSHAEQSQSQMYGDTSCKERCHADAQQDQFNQPHQHDRNQHDQLREHDATAPQYDRNQGDRPHEYDATSQYGRQHNSQHSSRANHQYNRPEDATQFGQDGQQYPNVKDGYYSGQQGAQFHHAASYNQGVYGPDQEIHSNPANHWQNREVHPYPAVPYSQGGYGQEQEAHSAQFSQRDQDVHAATGSGVSSLSVGSLIQIPAPEPKQGMQYGTIKWIGTPTAVKGRIAGIELVMHIY